MQQCDTYFVGEFDMILGEIGWTPASDRFSDVLGGSDNGSEADQENDGVMMVQSVGHIVVGAGLVRLVHLRHSGPHHLHLGGRQLSGDWILPTSSSKHTSERLCVEMKFVSIDDLIAS